MNVVISVVVCTYNRAHLLPACLESLAAQSLARELYEVIIVNNNSTDATLQVAGDFTVGIPNFRVVTERRQGLSHARNRGWQEAAGSFVAYIDDDARACTDWLSQMFSFIERNPEAEAFGGPYDAIAADGLPGWFPPECGSWNLGDQERSIRVGEEFINGTNMVFTRRILATLGGFNTTLGMMGRRVAYGEETRLLLELSERGMPVSYVPAMKVRHLVMEFKISLGWLLFSAYRNGCCSARTFLRKRSLPNHLTGMAAALARMPLLLFRFGRIPVKRRIYYALAAPCAEWGALLEHFNVRRKGVGN